MAEPERAGDRAVARLGEMLALTLMLPLGDGLYRGDPITLSEIALFCGGALAAVAGETWPSIRGRLSNQFSVSVSRAASNFYLWLLLLAFVYGVFAVREPRPIPVLVLFTLIWGVLVGTIFLRRRPAGALAVPESVPPESAKPDPFLIHDRVGWYADGRRDVNSEMVVEGPLCPHDRCDLFCRVTFDPNRDRKAAEDGDNIGIGTHRLLECPQCRAQFNTADTILGKEVGASRREARGRFQGRERMAAAPVAQRTIGAEWLANRLRGLGFPALSDAHLALCLRNLRSFGLDSEEQAGAFLASHETRTYLDDAYVRTLHRAPGGLDAVGLTAWGPRDFLASANDRASVRAQLEQELRDAYARGAR